MRFEAFFLLITLFISLPVMAQDESWKAFTLNELIEQHQQRENPYLRFLDESSMSMGLYVLKAGAQDGQSPHRLDEVYYIVEGKAVLTAGEHEIPVEQGSIVYVKAEVSHKFHSIEKDLKVLVVFPTIATDPLAPIQESYSLSMYEPDVINRNSWSQILDVPSIELGYYTFRRQLARADTTEVYNRDIVIMVTKGSGTLKIGGAGTIGTATKDIDLKPGSIVYLESSTAHSFESEKEGFGALILYEKRN